MSNPINVTVKKEAIDSVKQLRNEISLAHNEALQLSESFRAINKITPKTPGGLSNSSASNVNLSSQIEKQAQAVNASQLKIQQAYERTRIADIKLAQQREKNIDAFIKNETKAQALLDKSTNVYNKVQQKVNQLTTTYNNLATKRELGVKLSIREEAQLTSITPRLQKYNDVLKKVDADIGKYGRNVGNYDGATRNLNNSIGQISRELPNFGQSFSIGILSLTNNIGALQDSIRQTVEQNKLLKAEGKATTSVLSGIGSAVFSWTTALYIGIGIFSAYSKEIGEFTSSLIKNIKGVDSYKESIKAIGEASKEGTKNAQQELISLNANLAIAKDLNLSYKDRLIAVDNLQKQYPYYFENLTKEQILAGQTTIAENALRDAILSRAKAQASTTKITENQGKIIDLEEERIEVLKRLEKAEKDVKTAQDVRTTTTGGGTIAGTYDLETTALTRLSRAKNDLKGIDKEIKDLNEINNRLTTYALDNTKKAIGLDYSETKAKKEKNNARKDEVDTISKLNPETLSYLESLQEQINLYTTLREKISTNNVEWERYTKIIESLQRAVDLVKDPLKGIKAEKIREYYDEFAEGEKRVIALNKVTNDFLKTFNDGFLKDAGLGSLDKFLDITETGKSTFQNLMDSADTMKEKFAVAFVSIAEVAQEAFAFINQASQNNFDAEYSRLEKQRDISLKFAGESASAKENIERQYDERRRAIQRREAESNKKLALLNIAINTAQGIVSALAMFPPNIPLSIAIGVIGAVQAGIVAGQEIPQFFEGGTHKGGIMMVNDAKGGAYRETVVTPDGKVIKPEGRNVLMNAPMGTQIFRPDQQKELNDLLASKGISLSDGAMRGIAIVNNNNSSNGVSDLALSRIENAIKSMPRSDIRIDKKGISAYTIENGQRTERMNNRQHGKG